MAKLSAEERRRSDGFGLRLRLADKIFVPLFRRVETSMPLAADVGRGSSAPPPIPLRIEHGWLDRKTRSPSASSKAPWERALESLEAMLSPAQPVAQAPAVRTKRLVWLVDPDTLLPRRD